MLCISPDRLTVRVLCICTSAQCKFVNTFFVFFPNQGFLSSLNYGGELVANIEHCLSFTETIAHGNPFLALWGFTTPRGMQLEVVTVHSGIIFIQRLGCSSFPSAQVQEKKKDDNETGSISGCTVMSMLRKELSIKCKETGRFSTLSAITHSGQQGLLKLWPPQPSVIRETLTWTTPEGGDGDGLVFVFLSFM